MKSKSATMAVSLLLWPLAARAADAPAPPSPYGAATAGEFAASCNLDQGGCADIIGNALMDKIQYSPTSNICLPNVNYADAVAPWLRAHPETAKMPTADGIYLAIVTLYKCGRPNNY